MTIKVTEIKTRDSNATDWKARQKPATIHIFPKSESLIDNLNNRRERPYTAYKKEVLPAVMDQLEAGLGIKRDSFKIRWSQYAGCTCPCSPGFVMDELSYEPKMRGKTVFVTIE